MSEYLFGFDYYKSLMGNTPFTPKCLAEKSGLTPQSAATILCRYVNRHRVKRVGRIGDCKRNVWYQFGE
jgi:hypothetical protein